MYRQQVSIYKSDIADSDVKMEKLKKRWIKLKKQQASKFPQ